MATSAKLILTPAAVRDLADRLAKIPSVSQFDQPGEPQASTLAHALSDLEESCRAVVDTLLCRLVDQSLEPAELRNVLDDIGEELRHILYHIRDTRYFGYLFDEELDR